MDDPRSTRKIEIIMRLLNEFSTLTVEGKIKQTDYTEGVRDTLCALNLVKNLTA